MDPQHTEKDSEKRERKQASEPADDERTPRDPSGEETQEVAHAGKSERKKPTRRAISPVVLQGKGEGDEQDQPSNVSFDHSIVVEIAHREAMALPGIIEMAGGFMDGWMKSRTRGIRVEEIGQEAYSLRLNLIVEYGTNCPELSRKLTERISHAVKHHTGRHVQNIHVHIAGIKDRQQRDEVEDEDEPFAEEHGIGF